jgi:hypothetical protein
VHNTFALNYTVAFKTTPSYRETTQPYYPVTGKQRNSIAWLPGNKASKLTCIVEHSRPRPEAKHPDHRRPGTQKHHIKKFPVPFSKSILRFRFSVSAILFWGFTSIIYTI